MSHSRGNTRNTPSGLLPLLGCVGVAHPAGSATIRGQQRESASRLRKPGGALGVRVVAVVRLDQTVGVLRPQQLAMVPLASDHYLALVSS